MLLLLVTLLLCAQTHSSANLLCCLCPASRGVNAANGNPNILVVLAGPVYNIYSDDTTTTARRNW
ncbi:uncharacterized protein SCHCODRAFT_02235802 [Schizophyllum commune H4-8]|uniref:uncharacterized protein n=1 Tax=Schizophyllum commune (strain H4-8 / FGSC 9210) TaxID=578458 RepID=UPI00215F04C2|nr:uncharacterized protein SCHCODRAFT_02235802 [Schizophyllum commune H4-8]KAI5895607.1 hypothetical protein SCHCODRAFT_02235802 [Schizophyllum commune H4-8]